MENTKVAAYLIVMIIVIAVLYFAITYTQPQNLSTVKGTTTNTTISKNTTQQLMSIQLSDPPQTPSGTQAVFITYSSVALNETNSSGASSWVYSNTSGEINLMSLINISDVIGQVYVPVNATIKTVKFNVTSAKIELNNTNYSVTVPNREITAHILSSGKINASSSILVDMTPTIATILTSNSTIFVLVPSIKAIIIGNASESSTAHVGTRFKIYSSEKTELSNAAPNISIVSSTLSEQNNITSFIITVKNNGNQSITLNHLLIKGDMNSNIKTKTGPIIKINGLNDSVKIENEVNISGITNNSISSSINNSNHINIGSNARSSSDIKISSGLNVTSKTNSSINSSENSSDTNNKNISKYNTNGSSGSNTQSNGEISTHETSNGNITSDNQELNIEEHMAINLTSFKVLNFIISQNGSLTLPKDYQEFESASYVIGAGKTATLSFNGTIEFGNGVITASIIPNTTYMVRIVGENGASASENITAS